MIETVDSIEIASEIDTRCAEAGKIHARANRGQQRARKPEDRCLSRKVEELVNQMPVWQI